MNVIRVTCCVLGDCEVGKTSAVKVFQSDGGMSFPKNYSSTCGVNVSSRTVNIPESSDIVELYLLDCSGKDLYFDILKSVLSKSMMVALMYDVTNEESFNNCRTWINHVSEAVKSEQPLPGVLIANKIDLNQRRAVSPKAGQELAKSFKLQYFECSAKAGGIEAPFFYLANEWYKLHQDSIEIAHP